MKFLSASMHGFIDYAAAIALIIIPFLIFPVGTPLIATWLSVAAGASLIAYSLVTDYSAGVRAAIPFRVHLLIDAMAGSAFLIAPFVLGFEGIVSGYYFVMGIAVLLVVVTTRNTIDVEIDSMAKH